MSDLVFERSVTVDASPADVWAWHVRPGAFERLAPPWGPPRLLEPHPGVSEGSRASFLVPAGPLPVRLRWVAEHRDVRPGERFTDVQVQGPFARWEHTHSVSAAADGRATLTDHIVWRPPLGALGRLFAAAFIERDLERVFDHRHRVLERDLARHADTQGSAMKILVSGASGMLGTAVCSLLTTGGHDVVRLVRRAPQGDGEVRWDPAQGELDAAALEGVDAVVHLAGENIAARRWSAAQKARIRDSRTEGTRLLAETIAGLERKPSVFVSASAVGFYGSRGDEQLADDAAPGGGFLADVCQAWEQACQPARDAGIRTVNLRFGAILSPAGGALAKMLLPFKLGAGGKLGPGSQFMSWIAIDDAAGAVLHAVTNEELSGPVNAVAPNPVTNLEYTKALGRVLGRPTIFPMPGFVAGLAFGELADELLLASQRAVPGKLLASGFTFDEPEVEGALHTLLGKA